MKLLADGNLLIAYKIVTHDNHERAVKFFAKNPKVSTCAITELNLLRVLMQCGHTGEEADDILASFITKHRSNLISCDQSASETAGLSQGHKQTTDSYLATLAKKHGISVATLDEGFAARFPHVVHLVD